MEEYLYCYMSDEMAALTDGNTSPEAKAAFEKHILECAACRREWVEILLASDAPAEAPPAHIQEAIKAAVQTARPLVRTAAREPALVRIRRAFSSARTVSLVAAGVIAAIIIALFIALSSPEPPETTPIVTTGPPKNIVTPPAPDERDAQETVVKQGDEVPKKPQVKGFPTPEPEVIVQRPEPKVQQEPQPKLEVEPAGPTEQPEDRVAQKHESVPEPEVPKPESVEQTPKEATSGLHALKRGALPAPPTSEPVRRAKLAVKLSRTDRRIFRKRFQSTLLSVMAQEQELLEKAHAEAMKQNQILGRSPQPGAPTAPLTPQAATPKQDSSPAPTAPPPSPRLEQLRKEGKIPQEQPRGTGSSPTAPPELPRIEKLRKEGKIPQAEPGAQPQPGSTPQGQPAPKPGGPTKEAPVVPPSKPAGPARRAIVKVPAVKPEVLAAVSKEAGFAVVQVPKLKPSVILARAQVVEDSANNKVAHLFYYFGNGGFSVFERKTARFDDKTDYQPRSRTRSLMWAAGGREFVLVAQKLTKRQMSAIQAAICEALE